MAFSPAKRPFSYLLIVGANGTRASYVAGGRLVVQKFVEVNVARVIDAVSYERHKQPRSGETVAPAYLVSKRNSHHHHHISLLIAVLISNEYIQIRKVLDQPELISDYNGTLTGTGNMCFVNSCDIDTVYFQYLYIPLLI